KQVRDWFKARAEKLGCTVSVDDMGVMFARRAGSADVPPIAMGSHLDTQPTGGKFDGALGVLGALEALRTLVEAGYQTYAPIEVVNWTNEEGSRFTPAMLASGTFAGVFARDWAAARRDADAAAQERAARRRARGRGGRADRAGQRAARGRHRRLDGGEAQFAQRGAGRGVVHRRPAPSRGGDARHDGTNIPAGGRYGVP